MTQKEKTFLDQTAQRLHLTVDGESSILFGSVGGYQTMLRRNDQGLAVMTRTFRVSSTRLRRTEKPVTRRVPFTNWRMAD